jgi:hypothetical protein
MKSFLDILTESINSNLLREFWQKHNEHLTRYFDRGGCGIASKDLSEFLYSKKINNEIIITGYIDKHRLKQQGWFKIDNPEYKFESLTPNDIRKMYDSQLNPKEPSDIQKYAEDNNLIEEFKLIPHSWVEVRGVILDPSGFYIDGKSGQFDKLVQNKEMISKKYLYFKDNIAL